MFSNLLAASGNPLKEIAPGSDPSSMFTGQHAIENFYWEEAIRSGPIGDLDGKQLHLGSEGNIKGVTPQRQEELKKELEGQKDGSKPENNKDDNINDLSVSVQKTVVFRIH